MYGRPGAILYPTWYANTYLLNMNVINLGLDDSLSFSYKNKKTYNIKNLEKHSTRYKNTVNTIYKVTSSLSPFLQLRSYKKETIKYQAGIRIL